MRPGARDQFAALLSNIERVQPDHPNSLTTRGALAYWDREEGSGGSWRDLNQDPTDRTDCRPVRPRGKRRTVHESEQVCPSLAWLDAAWWG